MATGMALLWLTKGGDHHWTLVPMVITLPFILLLVDFWPLCRFRNSHLNPDAPLPDPERFDSRGSRKLLMAVGPYELMLERMHTVPDKYKALGELKAAIMVGCEFCIDIGAHISSRTGVTDEQLLALPRHRESDVFDDAELAVLDYAEAMTKTPAGTSTMPP